MGRRYQSGIDALGWGSSWASLPSTRRSSPMCAICQQGTSAHSTTSCWTNIFILWWAKANEFTNAICNLLWETNREIYAEGEFDANEHLTYTPPPLNDVWLDKESHQDKRVCLREQRQRAWIGRFD